MRATRRALLRLPLVVAVVGCAPSPVIVGVPGDIPEPEPPTRSAEAAAVAAWVAGFAARVDELASNTAAWGADDQHLAWITALLDQSTAHVARVVAADPVMGGPAAFPTAAATVSPTAAPTTAEEAVAVLTADVAAGTPTLQAGLAASGTGQERLFHASLIVAVNASLTPALPPIEGGAGPAPFDTPDSSYAFAVALGHVRALIRGLEVGLGRLPSSDDRQAAGTERLDAAKSLRNALISSMPEELPEIDLWQPPDAMTTPEEILAVWVMLEGNVLDACGLVVATGGPGAMDWMGPMLGQVRWMHRWGGRLPYWPGWVATP